MKRLVVLSLVSLGVGCTPDGTSGTGSVALDTPGVQSALDAIRPEAIEHHIRVLADDSLQGRAPGTPGFEGAARYAEAALRALGLEPAGVDGTYRQPVPLRQSMIVVATSAMSITSPSGTETLEYDTDFYLGPDPLREAVDLDNAPVAFVGFGVSAPALGYDSYADINVDGKVVAFLSGAPATFPSNERAYYSSGATKRAEALARGAIGTLTFWDPTDPRFRWEVNAARAKRGSFAWLDSEGDPNRGNPTILGPHRSTYPPRSRSSKDRQHRWLRPFGRRRKAQLSRSI